jgi:hypothetical protein
MKADLSTRQLDKVLSNTNLSDLNTHMGGCRSVVVGIGNVVQNSGIVAPTDENNSIIHAFIKVEGSLFEADGLAYRQEDDVVHMIHRYNPFDSKRYRPEHFPMRNLTTGEDSLQDTHSTKTVDQYLLEEYVIRYPDVENTPNEDRISTEVANRVQSTIKNYQI